MENKILGIHHITAIAGGAKRNLDFYTKVLGQRFVKKTVNFDDPGTYHFYFGDEMGSPGSILTFFPWEGITKGKQGPGMATEIGYSVPPGSLAFWVDRLKRHGVRILNSGSRLGEEYVQFEDPDGLVLALIIPAETDPRKPWTTTDIGDDSATRGFHSITLSLRNVAKTADVLTKIFGYNFEKEEGGRHRYRTESVAGASAVDLLEASDGVSGINAAGTIHHVAFRVKDEAALMEYREKVLSHNLQITPKIDRNYFFSLYFREPGGVLFEIATDNPGFAVDEPVAELGKNLKLPAQYENSRARIEEILPALD